MRRAWRGLWLLLPAAALSAQTVTLPAAASIVGGAPFFSDVRAFNTSYTQTLDVMATYRCFLGACPSTAPVFPFSLAPRESRALDNICVTAFQAPNSAGGVEFAFSGAPDQLVVTSRLYSTEPTPTVGMFIPGLLDSEAFPTTVLTSIRNGGSGEGFRTNVGVFNNRGTTVAVSFTIFDDGAPVGVPVTLPGGVPPHSGWQVNGIFTVAGVPGLSTENAVIVLAASGPVFSYAAVIDNATTDPIFVVGAVDQPPQAVTAASTPTRTLSRTATRTTTILGTTATHTPTATATSTPPLPGAHGHADVDCHSNGDAVAHADRPRTDRDTYADRYRADGDADFDTHVHRDPHADRHNDSVADSARPDALDGFRRIRRRERLLRRGARIKHVDHPCG